MDKAQAAARIARAHRKTLADALRYAREAREAGDDETAAQFDRMAAYARQKLARLLPR